MGRHYLDHASTSPARPAVVEAMLPWLTGDGAADPGRVHTEGRMARAAIESAREQVAALLGARPREVVFTSGATESIHAAVWGAAGRGGGAIAVADVEHSAVRDASARHKTVTLAVDGEGRIDPTLPDDDLGLVHCQWGNHEVGTLQPVAEIVAACKQRGVLSHVDAAQAAGRVPIAFDDLGADLMSVSAHTFGGPKGIGALLVRRGLRLDPLFLGGEQERARRAGLENVPAIVGFGAAAEAVDIAGESARNTAQTQRLLTAATSIPGVVRFGGDPRLPHIVCVGISDVEAEAVLLGLDQAGIAAHSGSACSSESLEPSPVLQAMGVDAERSLRFSVGWSTTEADVDAAVDALPRVIERLRALR